MYDCSRCDALSSADLREERWKRNRCEPCYYRDGARLRLDFEMEYFAKELKSG